VQLTVLAPLREPSSPRKSADEPEEIANAQENTPLCEHRCVKAVEVETEDAVAQSPVRLLYVQVTLLTLLWWTTAVIVVLYMKRTLTNFHYPFAITWLCNTFCGLMALILAFVIHPEPLPPICQDEVMKLLIIGIVNGVEIGCCNKALESLSVSSNIMLGSVKVLFQMATALCWGLERLTWLRVLTGLVFVVGGFLQGYAKESAREDDVTSIEGVFLQLTAIAIGSQRFAFLQYIMQRASSESFLGKMSKLQLVAGVLPITGVVCMCMAALFEAPSFRYEHLAQPQLYVSTLMLASGVVILVVAELKITQLTSAVTLQVLMTLHTIPIVLAGVLILDDDVSFLSAWGFVACLIAALLYAAVKIFEKDVSNL